MYEIYISAYPSIEDVFLLKWNLNIYCKRSIYTVPLNNTLNMAGIDIHSMDIVESSTLKIAKARLASRTSFVIYFLRKCFMFFMFYDNIAHALILLRSSVAFCVFNNIFICSTVDLLKRILYNLITSLCIPIRPNLTNI